MATSARLKGMTTSLLVIFAMLSVAAAAYVVVAQSVGNEAAVSNSEPFIEAIWELPDFDGDPSNGVQVTPTPDGDTTITQCVVACDTNGINDVIDVTTDVLKPEFFACEQEQTAVGGLCNDVCPNGVSNDNACKQCLIDACLLDQAVFLENGSRTLGDGIAVAPQDSPCRETLLTYDPDALTKAFSGENQICEVYTAAVTVPFADTTQGRYTVFASVDDPFTLADLHQHQFDLLACVGIAIDHEKLVFDAVNPGETTVIEGDTIFDPAEETVLPTIRNICQFPIDVKTEATDLVGKELGDVIPKDNIKEEIKDVAAAGCFDVNVLSSEDASLTTSVAVPLATRGDIYEGMIEFTPLDQEACNG